MEAAAVCRGWRALSAAGDEYPAHCDWTASALAGFDPSTREEAGAIVLYSFLCGVIDSQVRAAVRESEDKARAYLANYRRGQSPLAELWWNSLLTVSRDIPIQGTAEEVSELEEAVERVGGTAFPYDSGEDQPPEQDHWTWVCGRPPLDEPEGLEGVLLGTRSGG